MALTNDIATALATKLAAVSGMVGAAATGSDTIPDTPYAVLGPARSSDVSPGAWEVEAIDFPFVVLVGAVVSESDSLAAAYDLKDAIQSALRTGIKLGLSASGVAQSLLTEWDTDTTFRAVGGEEYQALSGTIRVTVARGMAGTWTS